MSAALAVTMSATFVVLVPATTVPTTTMSAAVRAEVVTGTVRGVVGDPLHPGLELVISHAGAGALAPGSEVGVGRGQALAVAIDGFEMFDHPIKDRVEMLNLLVSQCFEGVGLFRVELLNGATILGELDQHDALVLGGLLASNKATRLHLHQVLVKGRDPHAQDVREILCGDVVLKFKCCKDSALAASWVLYRAARVTLTGSARTRTARLHEMGRVAELLIQFVVIHKSTPFKIYSNLSIRCLLETLKDFNGKSNRHLSNV